MSKHAKKQVLGALHKPSRPMPAPPLRKGHISVKDLMVGDVIFDDAGEPHTITGYFLEGRNHVTIDLEGIDADYDVLLTDSVDNAGHYETGYTADLRGLH